MADIKKTARQYVAITHTSINPWNHKPELEIVLIGDAGESKESVEEQAQRKICGEEWGREKDIYVDTELKNLFIVSLGAAKRSYSRVLNAYYDSWEAVAAENGD